MTVHLGENPLRRMAERLKHQERDKQVWIIPCRSCGAAEGKPCFLKKHMGVPSWTVHQSRLNDFNRVRGRCQSLTPPSVTAD